MNAVFCAGITLIMDHNPMVKILALIWRPRQRNVTHLVRQRRNSLFDFAMNSAIRAAVRAACFRASG